MTDIEADTAAVAGRAPPTAPEAPVALERLEDQLGWYEEKSDRHKRWFQALKVIQIVTAAVIPVTAGLSAPVEIAGALGALIVILEGIQQLFQLQQNWLGYRATAEALKHEKFLYLSRVGPYATAERPHALLAERVESLVAKEHAAWASAQREQDRREQR